MIEIEKRLAEKEKAALVGLILPNQNPAQVEEYLEELAFLATTSGAEPMKRFLQRVDHPDVSTYVRKGKLEEIKAYAKAEDIDMLLVDDELSPSQVRNLEKALELKVIDRSLLILDIFSLRAQTSQARTQVELAQYEYLLPRLTGLWTHLSKQRGGIGMKGPGETELETDRRIVRERISLLKGKLAKIDKQSQTQRKGRGGTVRVALVGYTNVGKSTLLNLLAKEKVFAENKLFATVGSTVRKVVIDRIPFLLSDTVGFIRKLPTMLIESFKSTLDEIREADLLLHVVDASHPQVQEHIDVVEKTLKEIGAGDKPSLLVLNKMDRLDDPDGYVSPNALSLGEVRVSAAKGQNIDELRQRLIGQVREIHFRRYPNTKNGYGYIDGWDGKF